MATLAALTLADARFPGGGHVHSGGVEEAVARGLVHDVDGLAALLDGRLRTAGLVAASFAAAAALAAPDLAAPTRTAFAELDAELDARTPSPAQRTASRAQGRATLRAARLAWPSPALDALCAVDPRPHHALLAGAVVGADGGTPADAAQCVAYLAVSGPASAAIRLLGLDPFAVNAVVVGLAAVLRGVVGEAVRAASGPPSALPAPGAPVLDLMAQAHVVHHRERVRLFAS
ncbi:urease accessory protein UreF [Pseudonocardia oceani]|uniref:urease accessory protein UreF n=1 Tax=Pseudonocardia oceani TaxID=2792013 RepID=UPI001C4A2ECF|nr:urease accessory UreF family protein [Pseudonocardia oceani]MBW0121648.1 urease accessory protein UreF [Pseudonocardia oceani]